MTSVESTWHIVYKLRVCVAYSTCNDMNYYSYYHQGQIIVTKANVGSYLACLCHTEVAVRSLRKPTQTLSLGFLIWSPWSGFVEGMGP